MSDQPKPATRLRQEATSLRETTTRQAARQADEWTAEYVQSFVTYDYTLKWCAKVADAHNAALAAEREVGHNTAVALGQQIIKLEDQLAIEQERWEPIHTMEASNKHLTNQLAAERERTSKLVDALERIRDVYPLDEAIGAIVIPAVADPPVQLPMINDDPVVTLK